MSSAEAAAAVAFSVPGTDGGDGDGEAGPDARFAAWIVAVAGRDERALTALYDATVQRVYARVHRIVRDAALAEEVVEDTYFQVWRQAAVFDPARGRALVWLTAIARSRAIDALRREGREGRLRAAAPGHAADHGDGDDDPAANVVDDAARPGDELLDLARRHAGLHEALARLEAQPRQLVSLAYLRGLSHEEIARQMRLPLGTVKSQIRRALPALRGLLGDSLAAASSTS